MDIFTIINVIFAFGNILLAYFLLKETRLLREAETYPEIIVLLERSQESQGLYDIVVRNIGKGSAYKIKFDFDPKASIIDQNNPLNINYMGFFQGVSFFGPNQEYRSTFGDHKLFKDTHTIPLIIKVEYQDKRGKRFNNEYLIDPMIFHNRSYILRRTINDFHDELKKIRENVSDISDHIKTS